MSRRAVGVRCIHCDRLLYTECGPKPCAFRQKIDASNPGVWAQRRVIEWCHRRATRIQSMVTEEGCTRDEATAFYDTYEAGGAA